MKRRQLLCQPLGLARWGIPKITVDSFDIRAGVSRDTGLQVEDIDLLNGCPIFNASAHSGFI